MAGAALATAAPASAEPAAGVVDGGATDTDLDPSGQHLRAIAYDRVDNDPATPTTLYGISRNQRALVTIGGLNSMPSPNLGGGNRVSLLGVTPGDTALDISPSGGAFAALDDRLYAVNLGTGAASSTGALPTSLRGLAIVPAASVQFDTAAVTAALGLARGRRSATLKPSRRDRGRSLRLRVVSTDAAGNKSTVTRTLTVTR